MTPKKSGGVTMSHLRFGHKPYQVHLSNPYRQTSLPVTILLCTCKYNMVQELVDGGTFLLNCPWDMEGLEKHLPGQVKEVHR